MYRRNISHILYMAAGLLGLFIVFESWMKPSYIRPPVTAPAEQASPSTPDAAPAPAPEDTFNLSPKHARTIDPASLPATHYQERLAAIKEEIEKRNLGAAETQLSSLPPAMQSDASIRPYLAVLWNNLGIEQETRGGTKLSVHAFKKASEFDGKNPVIQMNLAHAYWEQRDPAMTMEFLERLIALAPNEPFPHLAMADLLQERDRLNDAARHLDLAAERAGNDSGTQSYLHAVTAKVRRTEQIEGQLNSRASTHFTVKYDGEASPDTWMVVLEILEEAYREIGQRFGHFPSKPIVVVLLGTGTFHGATGSPAWADGLFDPVLGRIQIPTQGAVTDRVWLKRVLRHEFVHALLHDMQGVGSTAIPTWLNEGLAMQLSSDQWNELDQLGQEEIPVVPLTALEGGWGGLSSGAASVAYFEANSAVRYLINRYGMHEVTQLLDRLKKKQAIPAAMQSQLSLSYDQFQSRWLDQLHEERKKG